MAKRKVTTLRSFDDVDQALLELGQHETMLQHEEAVMNDGIQRLRDAYDKATAETRERALSLQENVEAFCIEHKDEFERSRSKDLVHGTVSFRTTPPKVMLLNRKYNWKTVLELLKKLRLARFVRTQEEVDKEGLLAASAAREITDEKLAAAGLKIDQAEQFNIDIKWDSLGG